jgi:hypothetical protein
MYTSFIVFDLYGKGVISKFTIPSLGPFYVVVVGNFVAQEISTSHYGKTMLILQPSPITLPTKMVKDSACCNNYLCHAPTLFDVGSIYMLRKCPLAVCWQ